MSYKTTSNFVTSTLSVPQANFKINSVGSRLFGFPWLTNLLHIVIKGDGSIPNV